MKALRINFGNTEYCDAMAMASLDTLKGRQVSAYQRFIINARQHPPFMNVIPSPIYHEREYSLCSCNQRPIIGQTNRLNDLVKWFASVLAVMCKHMQQLPTTCASIQQGVQTDITCNIQQCWELLATMLHLFVWGFSLHKYSLSLVSTFRHLGKYVNKKVNCCYWGILSSSLVFSGYSQPCVSRMQNVSAKSCQKVVKI